jgi:hypothetical protein
LHSGLCISGADTQIEGKETVMPPVRFLLLIGLVIVAAALTLWLAALVSPAFGASSAWVLLPLLVAGALIVLRIRS